MRVRVEVVAVVVVSHRVSRGNYNHFKILTHTHASTEAADIFA